MKNVINNNHALTLKSTIYESPISKMIIISDDAGLYLLEFYGRKNLDKNIENLCREKNTTLINEETTHSLSIKAELDLYFKGALKKFRTPIHIIGTPFQKIVWNALIKIPFGEKRSYLEQARLCKHPKAFRAVANANGKNQLAIIIPCHRVINNNGNLGGYGGGLEKKKWLLKHENKYL